MTAFQAKTAGTTGGFAITGADGNHGSTITPSPHFFWAEQANFDYAQIINFYFYFHHQLAGLDGILFSIHHYNFSHEKI